MSNPTKSETSNTASPERILTRQLTLLRQGVLVSYFGLVLFFLLSTVATTGSVNLATPIIWLLQALPLLIFAKGLLQMQIRTYGWMCFVVLMYFTHAVLVAFDPSRRWLGITEVVLCVSLFCFLIVFVRQYKEHFQVNM